MDDRVASGCGDREMIGPAHDTRVQPLAQGVIIKLNNHSEKSVRIDVQIPAPSLPRTQPSWCLKLKLDEPCQLSPAAGDQIYGQILYLAV